MNLEKQRELIEYIISSPDAFSLCQNILDPEYFDPTLAHAVGFILDYYEAYNGLPKARILKAETNLEFKTFEIEKHELSYVTKEIEKFCRKCAMEDAIMDAAQRIAEGEYDGIEESVQKALLISIQTDLGLEYYDTVEERLERLRHGNEILPTKWKDFNEKLFGGPARKELVLFAAGSGGGKSVVLSNLALDYSDLGHNVLYISLELSQDIVAQRFDSMITGIGRKIWEDHIPEIVSGVRNFKTSSTGRLDLMYMPTESKCNEIRAYLKNYQMHFNCTPDVIVVDYLDKLSPNSTVSGNAFDVDKKISEQLRQIGVDYNAAVFTASQLNRSAVGEDKQDHSMIAGGISKINESDTFISLYMDEYLRAAGEMNMQFQKTRNSDGVGQTIKMSFDIATLKITDGDNNDPLIAMGKKAKNKNVSTKTSKKQDLSALFDDEDEDEL